MLVEPVLVDEPVVLVVLVVPVVELPLEVAVLVEPDEDGAVEVLEDPEVLVPVAAP